MTTTTQIAKHFREVHFGGNWTSVNLKQLLKDVNWQQATTKVGTLHTIAVLVFHVNYYVSEVLKVLNGEPLVAHDKYSFLLPPIESETGWQNLLHKTWADAEAFANKIEELPDDALCQDFTDAKYGNYYRNFHGIIEHTHYHLGQISLIKKMIINDALTEL